MTWTKRRTEEGWRSFATAAAVRRDRVLDQEDAGLDGSKRCKRLKERTPDCVLMATAFASIELAVDAMRMGATDFLRKPMTPEALRSAVAAAIRAGFSRRSGAAVNENGRRPAGPDIEMLTLNGFQISRSETPSAPSSFEHHFRVKHFPDGLEFTVTVAIDPEGVERVARLTRRRLEPGGAFWRRAGSCRRISGARR